MKEFFTSQLFSVIVGAGLTLITSLLVNQKKASTSLDTEIAKEKIDAYKKLYYTVCKLNNCLSPYKKIKIPKECFLGYISANGKEYPKNFCFPSIFIDIDTLYKYKAELATNLNNNRIFLDQSIINKTSFLDSYLGEICKLVSNKNNSYIQMVGFTLHNEIDQMLDSIESDILHFFNSDKKKRTISDFNRTYEHEHSNYKKTELYSWFSEDVQHFGDFPLCFTCSHKDDCPLNENFPNTK